jgi:hypothetical protein
MLSWLRRLTAAPPAQPGCVCGDGDFDFEIVGESHDQDRLSQISARRQERGDAQVTFPCFIRFEINSYTHGPAVRVEASGGRTIGHFPAEQATVYAPILQEVQRSGRRAQCVGVLVGGYGERPTFGVYLNFKRELLR